MRLVGATRWYTQLPFLIEAVVAGVVGAVLAIGRARRSARCSFIDDCVRHVETAWSRDRAGRRPARRSRRSCS